MAQVGDIEYTKPTSLASTATRRLLYLGAGHVFVALGVIGAFLPVMPTTVFLILAASCYARGSERFYRRLMAHPTFGPILRDWREHRSMTLRTKRIAISAVVIGFAIGFVFIPLWWIRVLHLSAGAALVLYLASVKTRG